MKGEIRQDITTGNWVIFAPGRGKRPSDFNREIPSPPPEADYDPDCPFCPGNENLIPPILEETAADHGNGWQTRVIPNKYPVLSPEGSGRGRTEGFFPRLPNRGRHEIVIEHPRHDLDLDRMTVPEVARILETFQGRGRKIRRENPEWNVVFFRNRGKRAGTSLIHPHSQLIAGDFFPPRAARRERIAREYFSRRRKCLICDLLAAEEAQGVRTVPAAEGFAAFVPFAAGGPFETWIIPRRHRPDLVEIPPEETLALAATLKEILVRLKRILGDLSYNCIIASPFRGSECALFSHWYLRIIPRLTADAGFELGTGIKINPGWPEAEAERLRRA